VIDGSRGDMTNRSVPIKKSVSHPTAREIMDKGSGIGATARRTSGCSILRAPRREPCTICTACAPDAVLTVRTKATTPQATRST
jgi:hypothetical protein